MKRFYFSMYEMHRVPKTYVVVADNRKEAEELAEVGSTVDEFEDGESEVIDREIISLIETREN